MLLVMFDDGRDFAALFGRELGGTGRRALTGGGLIRCSDRILLALSLVFVSCAPWRDASCSRTDRFLSGRAFGSRCFHVDYPVALSVARSCQRRTSLAPGLSISGAFRWCRSFVLSGLDARRHLLGRRLCCAAGARACASFFFISVCADATPTVSNSAAARSIAACFLHFILLWAPPDVLDVVAC